jgi:hypothetical protein
VAHPMFEFTERVLPLRSWVRFPVRNSSCNIERATPSDSVGSFLGFRFPHTLHYKSPNIAYRGLARDVIHDVTDGRRHVGGIFLRFNGNNVRKRLKIGHFSGPIETFQCIKSELRRQDLEDIHLPTFRFSWKLKKLCQVDFFVFESWQTDRQSFFNFQEHLNEGKLIPSKS